MATLQEILNRDAGSDTILTDIYRKVIDAMKMELIGTQMLALRFGPGDIPGSSVKLVGQIRDKLLVHDNIAEGAEIPISNEGYFPVTVTPAKYGCRPYITREMIEDSLFPVAERSLTEAAYQMAKRLDKMILQGAESVAGNTVTGGAAITVANITTAMKNLETVDFTPTDLILGANVVEDIRNIDTFVEANKAGVTNPSQKLIGTIFGMKVWVTNNLTSANNALVIDRANALYVVEKRPITIEKYNDVTRQIESIVLSARWAAGALLYKKSSDASDPTTSLAVCKITTT